MGMVHCYRCSLPGHYAVFEKPLFTLLINRNTYIFIRQGITFFHFNGFHYTYTRMELNNAIR